VEGRTTKKKREQKQTDALFKHHRGQRPEEKRIAKRKRIDFTKGGIRQWRGGTAFGVARILEVLKKGSERQKEEVDQVIQYKRRHPKAWKREDGREVVGLEKEEIGL